MRCRRDRLGAADQQAIGAGTISLVFLTSVLVSAVLFGLWPSLFACVASVLAYNFFFLPPLYTFTIADPENVVALFFFARRGGDRQQPHRPRARPGHHRPQPRAHHRGTLSASAASWRWPRNLDDLLWATVHQIALMLKVRVVLLLPEDERLAVRAGFPPEDQLDDADLAAARWCWEKNHPAGRGADTLPGAKRLFLPMRTGRGAVGVIGIDRDEPGPHADARPAAPAGRAGRPGRAGDRARQPGRGHGPRPAGGGNRPAALGAADLDLARSAHAAGVDPRLRHQPRPAQLDAATPRRAGAEHPGRSRAAQSLHRQPAGHDAAGIRAAADQDRADGAVRCDRQRVAPRRQGAGQPQRADAAANPTCRCSNSTTCCSSRRCSTCWTMRRNTRRRGRASRHARGATAAR